MIINSPLLAYKAPYYVKIVRKNVETSDLPLLQPYKRAFAAWQQEHGNPPELTVKLSTNGTDTAIKQGNGRK
jgi:hypothetical protein